LCSSGASFWGDSGGKEHEQRAEGNPNKEATKAAVVRFDKKKKNSLSLSKQIKNISFLSPPLSSSCTHLARHAQRRAQLRLARAKLPVQLRDAARLHAAAQDRVQRRRPRRDLEHTALAGLFLFYLVLFLLLFLL
jgi:hypothetical protein